MNAELNDVAVQSFIAMSIEQVRDHMQITREKGGAVVTFNGPGHSTTTVKLGSEVHEMTDQGVLEHFAKANAGDLVNHTNILSLAIDPLNPAIIYVGIEHGGIYKSTDGCGHWQAANTGLGTGFVFGTILVPSIAVDPQNAGTLYAAVYGYYGDYGSVENPNFSGELRSTVFKSTDGGAHWQAMDAGLSNAFVQTLAIDPLNPATIFAGAGDVPMSPSDSGGGVYKSTDGGAHWQAMNTGFDANTQVTALAIDPRNPATVYAVAGGSGTDKSTVYKSPDGGAHWEPANAGLDPDILVLSLAIDPLNPAIVYAGTTGGAYAITFTSSPPP